MTTLIKYLLLDPEVYREVAQKHLRMNLKNGEDSMIEHIVDMQIRRRIEFEKELMNVPEFWRFFKNHHIRIVKELKTEMAIQNIKVEEKQISQVVEQLLTEIDIQINKELKKTTEESFSKAIVSVIESMSEYLKPPAYSFFDTRQHTRNAADVLNHCRLLRDNLKLTTLEKMQSLYLCLLKEQKKMALGGRLYAMISELILKVKEKLPATEILVFDAIESKAATKHA